MTSLRSQKTWLTGERMRLMAFISQTFAVLHAWTSRNWREISWAFLLSAVCAIALEDGKDMWRGPSAYKVYLVGNLADQGIQRVFSSIEGVESDTELFREDQPDYMSRWLARWAIIVVFQQEWVSNRRIHLIHSFAVNLLERIHRDASRGRNLLQVRMFRDQ